MVLQSVDQVKLQHWALKDAKHALKDAKHALRAVVQGLCILQAHYFALQL